MTEYSIIYAPLDQATRTEQVVERLSNAIISGILQTDAQLPNENELSRLLGVSPVTVRDALNTLRARQLIDTRRGRHGGSFVCQVPVEAMRKYHPLRLMASGELADFSEFHCAVIGHSARLAAQRSTPGELRKLEQLIDSFAAATQPDARIQTDMRCLLTLASQSQSARLANQELEIQAEWTPLMGLLYQEAAVHSEVAAAWRTLLAALYKGDDLACYQLAQKMITQITDHLLECKLRVDTDAPFLQRSDRE
ncbi:FadR/GntR family transcriptional regulator [Xenorhabdus bovienii]|uniref:FadR/GntR family transcriptional regulator n=1 Tax=Xenorhabdus bovienii TaxID=40576 RepID=UPI0023B20C4C|nr:GntR family transcriptional regulator [Xenorhabdus bovienii]MDE9459270.1 GntR family transcriptional regulator [Xenorhabdus bovienii]MDE9487391.1 GntR family transcriptional regulator [Xenorhabdus bovienii]MDE9515462.1 GntR family transcriptional regulator [Xenorhabdus bovienii]